MSKKVLVVDDEIHIIKIIQFKLKSCGYEVVYAQNGEEGLEVAKKELPDIILLDIMMPVMNGYVMLEALKKYENTRDIPVVMVTAKTQRVDTMKAEKLGIAEYIFKPFSPDKVLHVVQKIIGSPP